MVRKILLTLMSLFLVQQSYSLLIHINRSEIDSWLQIFFVAWLINLFVTGMFAFVGFAYPTHQLLPKSYYKINKPNTLKQIYNALGVNTFRKVLLATLWRSKKMRSGFFNGTSKGIANLEEQSMSSEFGHLFPFILINILGIYFLIIGLTKLCLFTILINIVGNLYPILLQRYHRMRIQNLRKRQKSK